jgi:hypothetical protein
MQQTRRFLESLGLPPGDAHSLPDSPLRFPDGAQYRIEIPSVEGPNALKAVLEESAYYALPVQRVSQGSGILLLTDEEIREMARLGHEHGIEVSLFVGPRAGWDIGALSQLPAGRIVASRLRGADQFIQAIEDVRRACALGIRSVLVADEGLIWVLDEMRQAGQLPADLVLKVSVMMGAANPASIKLMERLGANTYNVPTDLTLAQIAAIRAAVRIPLDVYVESPDDMGGFVRHYEIPELVRIASPVYLKFGLRNAPNIYPSGTHLESTAVALTRERVRRARLGVDLLARYYPQAVTSQRGVTDLGIPVIEEV